MKWLDYGFVAVFAGAWPAFENFVRLPRVRAEIESRGADGRRIAEYRWTMIQEWALVAIALALIVAGGRTWQSVGLVLPSPMGLIWSVLVLALVVALLFVQYRGATRTDRARASVARQLAHVRWFLPASSAELAGFRALSVTAGVCEEILFRGFLMALLLPFTGTLGAVVISSVLFGLGHAYQGVVGIVKTGIVGLVMAGIYVLTGSLLAPIIVHALVDIASGQLAADVPAPA
jgi:membrane protease YdiL (CAAX protease family)